MLIFSGVQHSSTKKCPLAESGLPRSGRIANALFQLACEAFDHGLDRLELLLFVVHLTHVMASDLLRPHFCVPVHENVHHHDVVLTGWKNTQQLAIQSIHHSDLVAVLSIHLESVWI